ncbi:MAG: hypothetical protein ACUZ8H_16470 [Candidatus Anammoxibacter sp.]
MKKFNIVGSATELAAATAGAYVGMKISDFIPIGDERLRNAIPALGFAYLSSQAKKPMIKAFAIGAMAIAGQQILAGFGITGMAPVLMGNMYAQESSESETYGSGGLGDEAGF